MIPKIKITALFLVIFVTILCRAQGEIWIKVEYKGNLVGGKNIKVYLGTTLVGECITSNGPLENGNAFVWMDGEPVKTGVNEDYIIGPLQYNNTYYFVIDGKYATVEIATSTSTPDEVLTYNGIFSLTGSHNILTLTDQGVWEDITFTLKNSFGSGQMWVKNAYENLSSGGTPFTFKSPNFPVNLRALDQSANTYDREFFKWDRVGIEYSSNKNINISGAESKNSTFTANFKTLCNVTVVNDYNEYGSTGIVTIEGQNYNSGIVFKPYELETNLYKANDKTIDNIEYTFDKWVDGNGNFKSSSRTYSFATNTHVTLKAKFDGKPLTWNRNITSPSRTGQNIKLNRLAHPSPHIAGYEIWRKVKYDPGVRMTTVGSSVLTYTDPDYVVTHNTSADLLKYDVRAVYDGQTTDEDYDHTVFGEILAKENAKLNNFENIVEDYSISNYPNPYNPTTTINYSIKLPLFQLLYV